MAPVIVISVIILILFAFFIARMQIIKPKMSRDDIIQATKNQFEALAKDMKAVHGIRIEVNYSDEQLFKIGLDNLARAEQSRKDQAADEKWKKEIWYNLKPEERKQLKREMAYDKARRALDSKYGIRDGGDII